VHRGDEVDVLVGHDVGDAAQAARDKILKHAGPLVSLSLGPSQRPRCSRQPSLVQVDLRSMQSRHRIAQIAIHTKNCTQPVRAPSDDCCGALSPLVQTSSTTALVLPVVW
jgi:hypothetical protein